MPASVRARVGALLALAAAAIVAITVGVLVGGAGHRTRAQGRAERRQAAAAPIVAAPGPSWSLIATTHGAIPRYAGPDAPHPDGTIPARWYGGVSALPVIAQSPGWLEVRLATRPNGSVAWVRRADVTVTSTPYAIDVNLKTRRLELYQAGRLVLDAPAGVGTAADPTPTGHFFVAFFEASPSPGYGPFILVTSAHSTAIQDWDGSGDAVIGIHGPLGANALIGTTGAYISHGCVRLLLPALLRLRDVPAGSPITVTA